MTRNLLLFSVLAVLGTTSLACSAYVDSGREQCRKNEDCAALGKDYAGYLCEKSVCVRPPVDQTWTCLDAPAGEPATGSVRVAFTLVDLLSQKPLPGVSLSLCAKLDATCAFPIAAQYQSNGDGKIEVEMPAGFDGYFQADAASIYPTLIFPPSTRKQRTPSTIPLVPAAFYPTMIRGVGTQVAADRSVVLITALDCLGRPAAGLSLSTSPQLEDPAVGYLLAGGMPSRSALVTDESGGGGFANIPAGGVLINSSLNGRLVGTAGVQTRPGFVSMVVIMPNGS